MNREALSWLRRSSVLQVVRGDRRRLLLPGGNITGDVRIESTAHRHAGLLPRW